MVVVLDEAVGGEEEGDEKGGVEEVVELRGAGEEEAFEVGDLFGEWEGGRCCCHGGE